MKYWVVRYDVKGFDANAEQGLHDLEVPAPAIMNEDPYDEPALAQEECDRLGAAEPGETIELDLKNGKHYKGPRYIYRIGNSDK